jgi:hypothetical protein
LLVEVLEVTVDAVRRLWFSGYAMGLSVDRCVWKVLVNADDAIRLDIQVATEFIPTPRCPHFYLICIHLESHAPKGKSRVRLSEILSCQLAYLSLWPSCRTPRRKSLPNMPSETPFGY